MPASLLTWTALLGRWIEFAKASLAIPAQADGERWRQCVPSVINLQAVTMALAELGDLSPAERAVALDKAAILVREHVERLHRVWQDAAMSQALADLVGDAVAALAAAERIHDGPGGLDEPSRT